MPDPKDIAAEARQLLFQIEDSLDTEDEPTYAARSKAALDALATWGRSLYAEGVDIAAAFVNVTHLQNDYSRRLVSELRHLATRLRGEQEK